MRLLLRLDEGGNPRHRQPDIGYGKLVGHNRPPSRSAKPYPFAHLYSLHAVNIGHMSILPYSSLTGNPPLHRTTLLI